MTNKTTAVPRYCKSCGGEIAWQEATWVMNRPGCGIEYYHAGCDFPSGVAALHDGETQDKKQEG
jgi:hypothetical protein